MLCSPDTKFEIPRRETCISIPETDIEIEIAFIPRCISGTSDDSRSYQCEDITKPTNKKSTTDISFDCCKTFINQRIALPQDISFSTNTIEQNVSNEEETEEEHFRQSSVGKINEDTERKLNFANKEEPLNTETGGDVALDIEQATTLTTTHHIEEPPKYTSLIEWILEDAPPNYGEATGKTINVNEVRNVLYWIFSALYTLLLRDCLFKAF